MLQMKKKRVFFLLCVVLQMKKKKSFFFFYALWIEDTAAAKEIFHAPVVQRTIVYIF